MRVFGVLIVLVALTCGVANLFAGEADPPKKDGAKSDGEKAAAAPKVVNDKRFHEALKAAAAVYKGYGRVDDESRWAPWLCRGPLPSAVRFSASTDAKTHGRKLYWLYAKDRENYMGDAKKPVSAGQVIVKESWIPEQVEKAPERKHGRGEQEKSTFVSDGKVQPRVAKDSVKPKGETVTVRSHIEPYVTKGGKTYRAKSIGGLFVMLKLDAKTQGTDAGWVYGTLTADGKTVTSAGRVASCMKCHVDAPRDRLFGLPKD